MQAVVDPATGQIDIKEQGRPVLRYNYKTIEPGALLEKVSAANKKYAVARSDYIHPLYGLRGETLTRDWPVDHPHHRGIYWAWPEVDYATNRGDLHALQVVFARPTGKVALKAGKDYAEIKAENLWMWEAREAIVREVVVIRAYREGSPNFELRNPNFEMKRSATVSAGPVAAATYAACVRTSRPPRLFVAAAGGAVAHTRAPVAIRNPKAQSADAASIAGRIIDLSFEFMALKEGVSIARRGTEHYGGLNLRLATPAGQQIVTNVAWSDLSGVFEGNQQPSGLSVFQHPGNPDYPGDWIQYPQLAWCQPTFPRAKTRYALAPGKPLVLRYRLWVHNGGKPEDEILGKISEDFKSSERPAFFGAD